MHRLLESRGELSLLGSLLIGTALVYFFPFPSGNFWLQLMLAEKPRAFYLLSGLHYALLFSTPFFVLSAVLSLSYIFKSGRRKETVNVVLPPLPEAGEKL